MIFNTFAYYVLFLLPGAVLFRSSSAAWRPRVLALLGSFFFVYFSLGMAGGAWGAACVLLFAWEATFRRWYQPGAWACWLGVAVSLLVLGVFKYWNFATGLLLGPDNRWTWAGAFLPLGVSFFTFEFIHYAVDRHKGRVERGSTAEYLAFIFFFPTLVAGPIKRFQDFLPALREPSDDWARDFQRGGTRILAGLVKKFALADVLTSLTDHLNAGDIQASPRPVLALWLFAYGWKIYFDFSAYSDIAIGSGRLFGISIPENFDWPYLRTDVAAFWRHWHMSLYRWLVDYVFIPLGGSRAGRARVLVHTLVVMLVSGAWHGAGTNFVAWGAWHGALLAVHRLWRWGPGAAVEAVGGRAWAVASWALTYVSVNLGWAFFAMDLKTAGLFLARLGGWA